MSNPPTCLAVDYGSTISTGTIDHLIGQKPVDPEAASALRALHDDHGLRIILASNTQPYETRWPALQKAGIDDLFSVVLLSYPLGVRILRTNKRDGRTRVTSGLVLLKSGRESRQRHDIDDIERVGTVGVSFAGRGTAHKPDYTACADIDCRGAAEPSRRCCWPGQHDRVLAYRGLDDVLDCGAGGRVVPRRSCPSDDRDSGAGCWEGARELSDAADLGSSHQHRQVFLDVNVHDLRVMPLISNPHPHEHVEIFVLGEIGCRHPTAGGYLKAGTRIEVLGFSIKHERGGSPEELRGCIFRHSRPGRHDHVGPEQAEPADDCGDRRHDRHPFRQPDGCRYRGNDARGHEDENCAARTGGRGRLDGPPAGNAPACSGLHRKAASRGSGGIAHCCHSPARPIASARNPGTRGKDEL